MCKFALKKIEAINGKQEFDKLEINGICQFDEFENELKGNKKYKAELVSIYAYMEEASINNTLPEKKFKDITPAKETVKEYEFRSKNLRVYAIKKENGKIVIFGGYKNRQKKEMRKFRAIKKEYLEAIK